MSNYECFMCRKSEHYAHLFSADMPSHVFTDIDPTKDFFPWPEARVVIYICENCLRERVREKGRKYKVTVSAFGKNISIQEGLMRGE